MIKGKKGLLLIYGVIIALIAAVVYSFVDSAVTKGKFPVIGDSSLSLIYSSLEAEKALFYIDQSAQYSAYQSIYDLAEKGGCYNGEVYLGYTLWDVDAPNFAASQCYPNAEASKNDFLNIFSDNLNTHLSKYEPAELPLNNYDIDFENNDLKALAKESLKIPIISIKEESETLGLYSIEPSFKASTDDYDFTDYDELRTRAETLVEICKTPPVKSPKRCIEENINIFNVEGKFMLEECQSGEYTVFLQHIVELGITYAIYGLCIKNINYQYYVYDEYEEESCLRNAVYRFALKLEDRECSMLDNDPNTDCYLYSCSDNYDSCESTDSCYCDNSYPCKGNCIPYCGYPPSPDTKCKDNCGKYGDCRSTSLCACDSLSACEGSCYCNPGPTYKGSCGGGGCPDSTRPIYRDYNPPTCHATELVGCTSCDPSCDICNCNYGHDCGVCGWDPC